MNPRHKMTLVILAGAIAAVTLAKAQEPQAVRLRGVIEKVDGNTVMARSDKDDELKLNLADKTLVVEVVKASIADIREGSFIGSGAVPQADGSQKAIEVHIFPESMRGTGEGFRPWDGAPHGTMTNGTVSAPKRTLIGGTVDTTNTSALGPTITVKYKEGEKDIIVTPDVPIMRFEVGDMSAIKPGVAFTVFRAVKKPDGSFDINRVNVGRDRVVPP